MLGALDLSWRTVWVGALSSLLALPVNLLWIFLFRCGEVGLLDAAEINAAKRRTHRFYIGKPLYDSRNHPVVLWAKMFRKRCYLPDKEGSRKNSNAFKRVLGSSNTFEYRLNAFVFFSSPPFVGKVTCVFEISAGRRQLTHRIQGVCSSSGEDCVW